MPGGPLPQCNQYLTFRVQMGEGWLQVWCYLYSGVITSVMSDDPVLLSYIPVCTMQLYQICMMCSFIQIRVFVVLIIRQGSWSVTNPSDMPTGKVLLPLVCKLVGYHPGRHLEYIKF